MMDIDDDYIPPSNRMDIDEEPVVPSPNIPLRKRSIKPRPNTKRQQQQQQRTRKRRESIVGRKRAAAILFELRQDFLHTLPMLVGPSAVLRDPFGALVHPGSVVAVHRGGHVYIKAYNSSDDVLYGRPTSAWKSMLDHTSMAQPLATQYTLYRYSFNAPPRSPRVPTPPPPRVRTPPLPPPVLRIPTPRVVTPPVRTPPTPVLVRTQPAVRRLKTQEFDVENPEDFMDPLSVNLIETGAVLVYFLDNQGRSFEDQFMVAFESEADQRANKPTAIWQDTLQRNKVPFTGTPLGPLEFRIARVVKKRKVQSPNKEIPVHFFESGSEDGFMTELQTGQVLVYFADPQGRTFAAQSVVAYASIADFLASKETTEFKYVLETGFHPFLRKKMTIPEMNLMVCQVKIDRFVTAQGPVTPLSAFVTPRATA
jgi:hypothetical protein